MSLSELLQKIFRESKRRASAHWARWEGGLLSDEDEESDPVPRRQILSDDQQLAARIVNCTSTNNETREVHER